MTQQRAGVFAPANAARKALSVLLALLCSVALCVSVPVGGTAQAAPASGVTKTLSYDSALLAKGKQVKGGACLCYCYSYASAMVMGKSYAPVKFNTKYPRTDVWYAKSMEGKGSGEFSYRTYGSGQSAAELRYVYDQVLAGHPVILYVSTKSGSQHWVCVVGVKDANRAALSLGNFLVLDSAYVEDGKAPAPMILSEKGYKLRFASDNVRVANGKVKVTTGSSASAGSAGGASSADSDAEKPVQVDVPVATACTSPTTLTYGSGFMPKGTVTSQSSITKMQGVIYDVAGGTTQTATVKPNKSKAKVESSYSGKKIAGTLKFSKLKPGTYSYGIRVWSKSTKGKKGVSGKVVRKTTFKVVAPKVALTKVDKASITSLRANWKKVSGASGFEVRYATKSTFAGAKKLRVSKSSAKNVRLKKLKPGTTYYVQVRSYKTSNGKRCYGTWSKTKKASTKASHTSTKASRIR